LPSFQINRHKKQAVWNKIVRDAIAQQSGAHDRHDYFLAFKKFTDDKFCFHHTDLLAIRERNEGIVKKLLGWKKKGEQFESKYDKFLREQLDCWEQLVAFLKPSIIVVASAFGRDLIKYGFKVKPTKGPLSKIFICEKEYPIAFMGMLSGQRAMDMGSR